MSVNNLCLILFYFEPLAGKIKQVYNSGQSSFSVPENYKTLAKAEIHSENSKETFEIIKSNDEYYIMHGCPEHPWFCCGLRKITKEQAEELVSTIEEELKYQKQCDEWFFLGKPPKLS